MKTLAIVCLAAVCAPQSALAQARDLQLRVEPYQFETSSGDVVEAELGELTVLENRNEDQSRLMTLRFLRFRSTASKPGPPILYLAGRAGGSGIAAARGSRFPLFMALRAHGDVIARSKRNGDVGGSGARILPNQPKGAAELRVGTDDDARLFLHGNLVHRFDGARHAWAEQDIIPITIRQGENPLVVKVCNRDSDWRFNLRITDGAGRSLMGNAHTGRIDIEFPPAEPTQPTDR